VSQLRLSLSALVITGMLFTGACGPQSEDTSSESTTSTIQLSETTEAEPDTSQTAEKKKCDYKDPTRRYVSRDPNECPAILFFCNEGETAFFNECGCGCVTNP